MEGNTIGQPFGKEICLFCFENINDKKRQKLIKDGFVPITRSPLIKGDAWHQFCTKYNMTP
jgi:hypothetical protein